MYQKLREHEPRCVEVYKYENRNVHMKYIDGVVVRDKLSLEAYLTVCDILQNIGEFCKINKIGFFNHDIKLKNFMIENHTNKVYMIDVDGFKFHSLKGI
jgi:tRNA A-37 threonylcarbamoyl transferase component Bud32